MYKLIVFFQDGREETIAEGFNPDNVLSAADNVARNPTIIWRIALEDATGPLRTVWSADWSNLGGIDPE